jgi:hypothetical protein
MRMYFLVTAIVLVLAFGYVEGRWTHRWQSSRALENAVSRLAAVPLDVGDWQGAAQELDARHIARGEIDGYLMRNYTNRISGSTVSVLLVCGRGGPTCLHTPEVCYPGAGFSPEKQAERQELAAAAPARPAQFWVGKFHKPAAAVPEALRIYWAWTARGDWSAPDSPRFHFASVAALYKLYVIQPLHELEPNRTQQEDPAVGFLKDFLPQLQRHLFPAPAQKNKA